eukprot:TRINITY_DN49076_c0_g1_i1.p1 TRINITY_DN49076_c0_g1~~TRINITY_DN49076_c0_g1_i1.p1  ORF type:complete len:546 (+),score=83.80 TRINITY_DN49076_c0_g1_i1:152-1639(+)
MLNERSSSRASSVSSTGFGVQARALREQSPSSRTRPGVQQRPNALQQAGAQFSRARPGEMIELRTRPTRQTSRVHVPGVGWMNHRQLSSLQRVLAGDPDVNADLSDLPDLSGMTSGQLERLEERLRHLQLDPEDRSADFELPIPDFGRFQRQAPSESESEASQSMPARRATEAVQRAERSLQRLEPAMRGADSTDVTPRSSSASLFGPGLRPTFRPSGPAHWERFSDLSDHVALLLFLNGMLPEADTGDAPQAKKEQWRLTEAGKAQLTATARSIPADQECAICYMELTQGAVALPCAKKSCAAFFHLDCIQPWLEKNPSCPLCRSDCQELVERIAPAVPDPDLFDARMAFGDLFFSPLDMQSDAFMPGALDDMHDSYTSGTLSMTLRDAQALALQERAPGQLLPRTPGARGLVYHAASATPPAREVRGNRAVRRSASGQQSGSPSVLQTSGRTSLAQDSSMTELRTRHAAGGGLAAVRAAVASGAAAVRAAVGR